VLAVAYGAIAFMLAAGTGRKTLAVGLTVALAVSAYLVNSLAASATVRPTATRSAGDSTRGTRSSSSRSARSQQSSASCSSHGGT